METGCLTGPMKGWLTKSYTPEADERTLIARLVSPTDGVVVTTRSVILLAHPPFRVVGSVIRRDRLTKAELTPTRWFLRGVLKIHYRARDYSTGCWCAHLGDRYVDSAQEVFDMLKSIAEATPSSESAEPHPPTDADPRSAKPRCTECGSDIRERAAFCHRCGTPVAAGAKRTRLTDNE